MNFYQDSLNPSALRSEPATVFCSRTLQLGILIWIFFQASLSRSAANNSATNERFGRRLSRFCDVETHQEWVHKQLKIDQAYCLGPSQGLSGETCGPFWSQDGPRLKNGTEKLWNTNYTFLLQKQRVGPPFRGLGLYCFLGCSRFRFVMILGARSFHSAFFWPHFESSGPPGKQLKVL